MNYISLLQWVLNNPELRNYIIKKQQLYYSATPKMGTEQQQGVCEFCKRRKSQKCTATEVELCINLYKVMNVIQVKMDNNITLDTQEKELLSIMTS